MARKKDIKMARLILSGLCESKAARFIDELQRIRKTTNLTPQWLYNRIKNLLLPGNFIACETCGMPTTFEGITIDHKVPRSLHTEYRGNVHNTDNLQLVCPSCNSMKGQKTLKEFLDYLHEFNRQLLHIRSQASVSNSGVIVAPLFPSIGLGLSKFGDTSETTKTPGSPTPNGPRPKAAEQEPNISSASSVDRAGNIVPPGKLRNNSSSTGIRKRRRTRGRKFKGTVKQNKSKVQK